MDEIQACPDALTPIEIKGEKHTASIAFNNYVKKYQPVNAFRFSLKNASITNDGRIQYLPIYLLDILLKQEETLDN